MSSSSSEEAMMGTVIRFPSELRKCPTGRLAYHPLYGLCRVVAAEGLKRTLEFERLCVTVDVRQLRPIDPKVDLAW